MVLVANSQVLRALSAKVSRLASAVALVLVLVAVCAQAQVVDRSSLTGKVLCGYQGWFSCPGDGTTAGWDHWSSSREDIGENLYYTDIWPDVKEYDPADLYLAPNVEMTSGKPAYLFSNQKQGVTNTHFRWMQENNIDGVFIGRFLLGVGGPVPNDETRLQHIMTAAAKYGRVISVAYDITGCPENELFSRLTTDWTRLTATYNLKNHSRYQCHNGRPMVMIWGLGAGDRPGTPAIAHQIIDWFKADGCFVLGGVPTGWRTLTGSKSDPAWYGVYGSFDGLSPWSVGAFLDWNGINQFMNSVWIPDVQDCNSRGQFYMPVAFPRFSWKNMHHYECDTPVISPRGGQHLWDQFYAEKFAGAHALLLAMFDEYDESTAIMKMSNDVPTTGCWWTTEGMPNDWWLRLTNYGSKMMRGEIPVSQTMPISPSASPDYAAIVSNTIPSYMATGQQSSVSLTVQNTGETCWNSDFFKLRAIGDSDPFTTTTKYAMATGTTVMPTQQYTFNFTMKAPGHNGAYLADWGMSHEIVRVFPAKIMKLVTVGTGPAMQVSSAFGSNTDGWTTSVWKAGTGGSATMAYNSSAGNPSGGGLRCRGADTTDDTSRCAREGGEAVKTISTVGYHGIIVGYDVRVGALGGNYTGPGTGTCTVDHNIIDEQLTVYYSTNAGATWTEVDCVQRQELLANYSSYGTRYIDLSGIPACDNNAGFRLRFRWQLNTNTDYGYLDNIKVLGNAYDGTPPGPVTNLLCAAGNQQVSLTWTNPSDPDFSGTVVRYRTDAYPTTATDGDQVAYKLGTPGAADGCIHRGLTNDLTYYYAAFARDDSALYAASAIGSATPEGAMGDWVNELFDGYPNGDLGGLRWQTPGLAAAQVESALAKGGTGKAALMDTLASGNSIASEITFTDKTSGYCYLSFDVCQDAAVTTGQVIAYVTIYGSDSATEVARVLVQKGRLVVEYSTGSSAVLTTSAANLTWYNVRLGFNLDSRTMDLWLDNVPKGTGYTWKGAATRLSKIVISSDRNTNLTTQKAYIDNLRLEAKPGAVTVLNDDGAWSPSLSKLHFSFDSVPGTTEYRYAVGTTMNGTQIRTWTSCGTSTDVIATGLSLAENQNYYITVQCANQYGTVGSNKTSDGIRVAPGLAGILDAKALADGTTAPVKSLRGKLVSAAFPGYFYIQEPDCLIGLKVVSPAAVTAEDQVDVCGVMKGSGAERYLDGNGDGVIRTSPGPGGPFPVMMSSPSIGGAELNSYTPGVASATGPNNIGLLITVAGKVTQRDPSGHYFYLDDGSGLRDGTQTGGVDNIGIRIKGDPASYAEGSFVTVTGISSCFSDGGTLKRQVLAPMGRVGLLRL
jgi:hypothetical protein